MNWLDVMLLIILIWSVIRSFWRGLTREVVGLASVVIAIVMGSWFYRAAGDWLATLVSSKNVANFCGFLIVFAGVMLLGSLAGLALNRLVKASGLSLFDRLLGAGFGMARGLLLGAAVVMAMLAFAPGAKADAPPSAVVNSRVAPYVVDAARLFAAAAPKELKDGFRKSYEQVKSAWADALKKGIHHKPGQEKEANERKI